MLAYAVPETASNDKMVEDFAQFRAAQTSSKHQAMLDVVIEHLRARLIDKDIERVMATMSPNSICRFFGTVGIPDYLGDISVRMLYKKSIDEAANAEGLKLDRVIVGDNGVAIEGRVLLSMELFAAMYTEPAKAIKTDRAAMMQKRVCTVYSMEDMKITAVNQYADGPYSAEDIVYLDDQSFDAGMLSRCPFGFLFKGH